MGSRRALIALLVLTLIWGYNWVLTKQALEYAAPFTFAAIRAVGGTFAMFAVLILMRRPLKLVAPMKTFWFGLFNCGGFLLFQNWALVEGGAGKTSVLAFTMPIWTLLLSWAFLGERVRGAQWLAAIGTLVGLTLIIAPWSIHAGFVSKVMSLLAAISWSVATIMLKRWRSELAGDLLLVTAWHMAFGSAFLLLIAVAVPEPATRWTPHFMVILAVIVLVSTALAWFLWLYVLERLPAWQAGLSVLGVPAVAILISRMQLGEAVEPLELAGMLFIGGGLGLLSFLNWRAERQRRTLVAP